MNDYKALQEQVESYSILVVEDEEEVRISVSKILEVFFKEVITAVNGQDALDKFTEKGHFDIVLTDLNMPKMDGLELVKKIKSINENVFIAIMSGDHDAFDTNTPNIDFLFKKPFAIQSLMQMLSKVVEYKNRDVVFMKKKSGTGEGI